MSQPQKTRKVLGELCPTTNNQGNIKAPRALFLRPRRNGDPEVLATEPEYQVNRQILDSIRRNERLRQEVVAMDRLLELQARQISRQSAETNPLINDSAAVAPTATIQTNPLASSHNHQSHVSTDNLVDAHVTTIQLNDQVLDMVRTGRRHEVTQQMIDLEFLQEVHDRQTRVRQFTQVNPFSINNSTVALATTPSTSNHTSYPNPLSRTVALATTQSTLNPTSYPNPLSQTVALATTQSTLHRTSYENPLSVANPLLG